MAFGLFCLVWISTAHAVDSEGSFEISTVNDPPYIVDWYHNTTLIEPGTDVLFHATVWDIDNTSDELTVTLWYSNDTFMYDNNSVTMVFSKETSPDYYRYNYTIDGPNEGIYSYYYEATDGEFTDYKPAGYNVGVYFDIQWISLIEETTQQDTPSGNWWYMLNKAGPVILIGAVLIIFLGYGAKTVLEIIFSTLNK